MLSFLLASLLVLARAETDCNGDCVFQRRTCVKDGGYCDEDSFDLFQNQGLSNYPCSGDSTVDRSSCYICDTGTIGDDAASSANRLCVNNICTETGQSLGDPCCSDWFNLKSGSPRDTNTCDMSVQGKFCKPQFRCDWNGTTGIGMCEEFSTIGARYLLGLGEACTLYDPETLSESSDDLNVCDSTSGLICDVGQEGLNVTDFYGREGTCVGWNSFTLEFYPSGECDNSNQCEWGKKCTGFDGTAQNRTCIDEDPSFCETDSDCGWGVHCRWVNPSDTLQGGVCGVFETQKLGQACRDSVDCVNGLYCDNDGVCEIPKQICKCSESEFNDCGRGKSCGCPDPALIGPKTKPGCRDGGAKRAADRARQQMKMDKAFYQCFNASQVKRAAGGRANSYFSVKDCVSSLSVPATLRRYRVDGSKQPSCPSQLSGSGVSSALLGGASYDSSASHVSPGYAFLPLLLLMQAFIYN